MRRVKDAYEFVRTVCFRGDSDVETLYTCEFSDYSVTVEAGGNVVAKILRLYNGSDLSTAVYRWFSEIYMHSAVEKRFPSETLELMDAFFDAGSTFVIIYERGYSIPRAVFDARISEAMDLIARMNKEGFVHLDTKPSNFLMRADETLVLHDWGLATSIGHEDEIPFDLMRADTDDDLLKFWADFASNSALLRRSQLRLLFTGFEGDTVPDGVDADIVGLPGGTMYSDKYFRVIENYLSASQPASFYDLFMDLVSKTGVDLEST